MTSAMAQNIGVSLAYSDDLFLTTLREAMEKRAKELGVKIQFEHAQGDIGKQLNQIQNFVAQKMNAIIVNPVDTHGHPEYDETRYRCRYSSGLREPQTC